MRIQANSIGSFLKLVRWPNLLIIMITMYFTRIALIGPVYQMYHETPAMSFGAFLLIMVSTILNASAGYIINDIFDIRIDAVNKPGKNILGKKIKLHTALTVYYSLTAFALISGFAAGWMSGSFKLGTIQVIEAAGLWFYSSRYKRTFFWGNFTVALISAFVVIKVWLFEFYALKSNEIKFSSAIPSIPLISRLILAYFLFAILFSFVREVIKDLEDIEGDKRYGCNTMAVKFGIRKTRNVTLTINLIGQIFIIILYVHYLINVSIFMLIYTFILVLIPSIVMSYQLIKATSPHQFHQLSQLVKFIMLTGTISMLFFALPK